MATDPLTEPTAATPAPNGDGATTPHQEDGRRLRRNSALLTLAVAVNAGSGGLFWLIAARRFSPEDVGIAGTVVSALTLIAHVSLCGLHVATVRFSRRRERADAIATVSMVVIPVLALIVALAYARGYAMFGGDDQVLRVFAGASGALVAIGAAVLATNLYTDYYFMARRQPVFNVICNGVVQGTARIALIVTAAATGAGAIIAASLSATAAALCASVIAMVRACGFRPSRPRRRALAGPARFALLAAPVDVLDLVAPTILPILVLSREGAGDAGAFYIAFQMALLANGAVFAITGSLFAEGARIRGSIVPVSMKALTLIIAVCGTATAVTLVAGRHVLLLFGGHYASTAHGLLVLLVAASGAVGLNAWMSVLVRLRGRQSVLIVANIASIAVVLVGFAEIVPRVGLLGYGWLWVGGNLACALVGSVGLLARPTRARTIAV